MAKQFFIIACVVSSLSLAACSSEPSDFRPGKKVSVDIVPPGTRTSPNLDNAADNSPHDQQQQVQLNHDAGANRIKGETPKPANEETNHAGSVENHQ